LGGSLAVINALGEEENRRHQRAAVPGRNICLSGMGSYVKILETDNSQNTIALPIFIPIFFHFFIFTGKVF